MFLIRFIGEADLERHQNAQLEKEADRRRAFEAQDESVWNEMMMLELPSELLAKSSVGVGGC